MFRENLLVPAEIHPMNLCTLNTADFHNLSGPWGGRTSASASLINVYVSAFCAFITETFILFRGSEPPPANVRRHFNGEPCIHGSGWTSKNRKLFGWISEYHVSHIRWISVNYFLTSAYYYILTLCFFYNIDTDVVKLLLINEWKNSFVNASRLVSYHINATVAFYTNFVFSVCI